MKPFTALSALGTAAHHGYEFRARVGLVFEPVLGRTPAIVIWSLLIPLTIVAALTGRLPRLLAFGNGSALAGGIVHFALWPWERRRGIPVLTEAEGLTQRQLPAYNAILWFWMVVSAVALLRETPRDGRVAALLGLLNFPGLRASARHHFAWAREQAAKDPERWSPALRG